MTLRPRGRASLALLLAALGAAPRALAAQDGGDRLAPHVVAALEADVRRTMEEAGLPSLTIALVDRAGLVWASAFGHANVWSRTPAQVETVYLIGSTFKAQSALAVLQQVERGRIRLDDPVRPWLGAVRIRREDAAHPVTFRQLLTHTSGLPAAFGAHSVWGEEPPALASYVRDSLQLVARPGEDAVYSNVGYALIGWLVERVSGTTYADYVRERVWQPLGMTSTAFAPTPAMAERLAIPYVRDRDGALAPTGWLKANVWPAGVVYGTVLDQARWLAFNLGDGRAPDGTRLVRAATLDQMQTLPAGARPVSVLDGWGGERTGYGLGWWATTRSGERVFAHSGGAPGYTAFLMGNKDRGIGVAILSNGTGAEAALARLSERALDLLAPAATRLVAQP